MTSIGINIGGIGGSSVGAIGNSGSSSMDGMAGSSSLGGMGSSGTNIKVGGSSGGDIALEPLPYDICTKDAILASKQTVLLI